MYRPDNAPTRAECERDESTGSERPNWANYLVEVEYPGRETERNWFREPEHAEDYADEVFDAMDTSEARETRVEIWSLNR